MLLTFRQHIESGNMVQLKKIYEDYVGVFTAETADMDYCMDKLGNMRTPELKALIMSKCLEALGKGIRIFIELNSDVIIKNTHNLLDICRINGILMDNAIEACQNVKESEIRIYASSENNVTTLAYDNTCLKKPPLNKLFKKGYTTKDGGNGLGLYNLRRMLDKNQNMTIETTHESDIFCQKIVMVDIT